MSFHGARSRALAAVIPAFLALALVACDSNSTDNGQPQGQDVQTGPAGSLPPGGAVPPSGLNGGRPLSPTCHTGDPNKICLALKTVSYLDASGAPVVSQAEEIANVAGINKDWAQCNVGFQLEQYQAVAPTAKGLGLNPANTTDLDTVRSDFHTDTQLLVVTTGTWDRGGSLGATAANAWTAMPGSTPYGAVLESPVGTFPNIIAHELGHYLNLDHVADQADLMNPVIYDTSTTLTPDQCNTARSAATTYWQAMLR